MSNIQMESVNVRNAFEPGNVKCIQVNNFSLLQVDEVCQKNFWNGLQNARHIVNCLEESIRKSNQYEKELLQCRASHSHSHVSESWESDISADKTSKSSKGTNVSRSQVDVAESWSTVSIVCLQYQYEELSKRYGNLLRAYDERSKSLNARDSAIARVRQRARAFQTQLAHTNKTLLAIGKKYMGLRKKRLAQKCCYEEKLDQMKGVVVKMADLAADARRELDALLTGGLANELDAAASMLLAEIRKCNQLCLENLRLKTKIEELAPGLLKWE